MRSLTTRLVWTLCLVALCLAGWSLVALSNAVPAAETPTPQPTDTALPGAVSLSASPGGTQVRLPLIYRRWPPLLSKEEAIQILLDQVKPATLDHDLLAFGLPEPLWPGDSVRPYLENGAAPMAISLSAPHWFFWVDDAPGAFFEHPTRYVLIDAYHGGISLQGEVWPPVVNEKPLWADAAQYWSPSHWVYYRLSEVPGQGYAELLISDTGNNRVLGCDIHGNIHFEIRGLNRPSDAEYGPLGQILIADTGNNRVLLTDRLGHIFRTIPAQDPIDVEWDPYLQDIYIVERSASRIVRLDGLDRVTWQATSVGGYALARPYDMEAGHFGLSLLANTGADELLAVHSRDGLRRLSDLSDGTVMVSPVDAEVLPNGHLLVTYSAGGHASRHGGAGADLLAGGDHVAEINADGAITFSAGGWQDAHDAEPFIAGDVLIVETGKSRVVRVDRFGHVLQEVHRLSDGSRLSAPLDVEVLVTPYRPNAPYIEPEGVGCPAMQDPPPGERECALVVNGIVQGEHLLGTAELDTQDMAAFFRCLGIQETVRVTSSLQAKAIMLATLDQMAQRCDDIVLVLEGHGASAKTRRDPTIRVGGSSLTLPELQAALRKHPNVDFKIVLESCYSGRWQEGLAGLENVKKVISSSDAEHPSYSDLDSADDPNPEDQGSEFLSGFRQDLWDAAQSSAHWTAIQSDAASRRIGFKEALLKYAFRSAVDKDCSADLTNPQESVDKPRTPTPTPTATRTPTPRPSPTPTACEPLYSDGFCTPGSGWPVKDLEAVRTEYYDGTYRLTVKQPQKWIWPVAPYAGTSEPVAIQVQAWRESGSQSEYGLVWGLNKDINEFYAFRVNPDTRRFRLSRYDPSGEMTTLIPWTDSEHIQGGNAPNWLTAVRDGSEIRLYIGTHRVASHTDATYTGLRRMGLWARSGDEAPVVLRYDNYSIWPMRCLIPAAGVRFAGEPDAVLPAELGLGEPSD